MTDPRELAEQVKEKATRSYGTRRRPCSPTEAIALADALLAAEQEDERLREAAVRCIDIAESTHMDAIQACGRIAVILGHVTNRVAPPEETG